MRSRWPLYAAGFTSAFGAHGIAASLGAGDVLTSLVTLGALLAVYDLAEVLLKPVFGTLADRVGARRVLAGGLLAFAAASALYLAGDAVGWLWAARLGQGAAAAAFSPAASALVARLAPAGGHGRAFGGYGFAKSLGYTLGPLLGGVLIWAGGLALLFGVLAALGLAVAVAVLAAVPALPPLPRTRQTVADLARRLTAPAFWRPTAALAAATAALSAGVGFLPVAGVAAGLSPVLTGAAVSVLALTTAVVQPWAGRALDAGRLPARVGLPAGLVLAAAGAGVAAAPGVAALLVAAVLVGAGAGVVTPLGFAALAATAPPERLGQTMGSAEVGRELGDAGGPLLVGAVAAAAGLGWGWAALAVLLAATALSCFSYSDSGILRRRD